MKRFVTQHVFEDSGIFLFARVKAPDGGYLQQADLGTITLKVYEVKDPSTPISEVTLTVADCVFDTLQTADSRWTKDSTGYNFRYQTTVAQLPAGGTSYVFEFKFTPVAPYVAFHGAFEVPCIGLYSS